MLEKTKDFGGFQESGTKPGQGETKVYLDHNATTPVAEEIISALPEMVHLWGNPSSIHWSGRGPKAVIRETRLSLAQNLGNVSPLELIFTSGGSEANSTVIRGIFELVKQAKPGEKLYARSEFITSKVEHPAVQRCFDWLEEQGAVVHRLAVNLRGEIDLLAFEKHLSAKTALVSIMYANNETGTVFPIAKMVKMAHAQGALFHSDCVQALGKLSLNLPKLELDYASFSAHKVYALKGTGVLFVKKGSPFQPLILGGAQERHRRGGTENTLGIWALGEMAKKLSQVSEWHPRLQALRDQLEAEIIKTIPGVAVTAAESPRLPNTSSMVIAGVDGETLLMNLDICGFAVSTGAACSSGSPEPSPVLLTMGLSSAEAQSSLRISLGRNTTEDELARFLKALQTTVARLRSLPVENPQVVHGGVYV